MLQVIILSITLFCTGTAARQEQGAAGDWTSPDGYGCVLSEDWDAHIVVEGFVDGAE